MNFKPEIYLSASAIEIYSNSGMNDEYHFIYGNNFLSNIVKGWEEEAMKLKNIVNRIIIIRMGLVLGLSDGTLQKIYHFFK